MASARILSMMTAALCVLASPGAHAELTAAASQDHISVDFFYQGSSISVRGNVEPGVDVVVRIASPDGREAYSQMGKIGFLWMTVGKRQFEGAPKLYHVYGSRPIDQILEQSEADRYVLGYQALDHHVRIQAPAAEPEAERERWFSEYVRFKEAANLYVTSSDQIRFSESEGRRRYALDAHWPHQAPPGEYVVSVFAVKGGRVVETATSKVVVEHVGSVRALASMAKNSGAAYGLLSIMGAISGGFGVGLIFRRRSVAKGSQSEKA